MFFLFHSLQCPNGTLDRDMSIVNLKQCQRRMSLLLIYSHVHFKEQPCQKVQSTNNLENVHVALLILRVKGHPNMTFDIVCPIPIHSWPFVCGKPIPVHTLLWAHYGYILPT